MRSLRSACPPQGVSWPQVWTTLGCGPGGGGHRCPLCRRTQCPGGPWHGAARRGTRAALTFEEHDLVVAGPLVHCVHAVQVQGQAPPEPVDLSRLEGDQVLIAGQSPEVLAWRDRPGITDPPRHPPALREKLAPPHVGSGKPGRRWELPASQQQLLARAIPGSRWKKSPFWESKQSSRHRTTWDSQLDFFVLPGELHVARSQSEQDV